MNKLALLIFSRNDVEAAVNLASSMYNIADEIVLIDSSDAKNRKFLLSQVTRLQMSKLKIHYAIALGYPDPLRMWALKKCTSDWVLLLDTDENPSKKLREDIKHIISDSGADALNIKRYEEVSDAKINKFFTWQIRLFKKNKVTYGGLLHEQPIINGKIKKLRDDYYLEHINELRQERFLEYKKIIRYNRLSYTMFNGYLRSYFKMGGGNSKFLHRSLNSFLFIYNKLSFKSPDREIGSFGYFIFYFVREIPSLRQNPIHIFRITKLLLWRIGQFAKWRREDVTGEEFAISKVLYRMGVIKMLDLDKDSKINSLNKKYINKKQGIDLLMELVKEAYKKKYSSLQS